MSISPIYTAHGFATGGRDGIASIPDRDLEFKMDPPKEMGGGGNGANPEQLFAAGYAACYIGAMKFATSQDKSLAKVPADTKVEAEKVAEAGHRICPYSNAVSGNVDVTVEVV